MTKKEFQKLKREIRSDKSITGIDSIINELTGEREIIIHRDIKKQFFHPANYCDKIKTK